MTPSATNQPVARPVRPRVARPRAMMVIAAAVMGLASCNRDKPAAPAAPAPAAPSVVVTPASAGAPFDYGSKTTYADVELKLPQGVRGQPDLHATLYASAVRDLKTFAEGAQADRTEAGGDGGQQPYQKTITFAPPVETGKLMSLARQDYEFTGGAHGMTTYGEVLWDKAMKRAIPATALFKAFTPSGADAALLDRILCAAINAEKKRRDPSAKTVALTGGDWSCPKAADTPFVLVASDAPGKSGGLTFLIGPYQVGPYSDGSYSVTVPQAAIHALLAPAYADEFGGAPVLAPPSN